MTREPNGHKRKSLFPPYRPPDDGPVTGEYIAAYVYSLAKRVVILGPLLATIGGLGAFLGARIISPGENTAAIAARVKVVEDSVREQSKRITATETTVHDNFYITCQVLHLVQPPNAILPEKCVDALIAARRASP